MDSPNGSAQFHFCFWVRPEAIKRNLRNLCNLRILILVFEGVLNRGRKT